MKNHELHNIHQLQIDTLALYSKPYAAEPHTINGHQEVCIVRSTYSLTANSAKNSVNSIQELLNELKGTAKSFAFLIRACSSFGLATTQPNLGNFRRMTIYLENRLATNSNVPEQFIGYSRG